MAFFNGYVLHRSLPNRAKAGFRRALVTHYMSAESMLPWTLGGTKARPDVRDIVMIAGEDPYAWRGVEEITKPWVRPDNAERQRQIPGRRWRRQAGPAQPAEIEAELTVMAWISVRATHEHLIHRVHGSPALAATRLCSAVRFAPAGDDGGLWAEAPTPRADTPSSSR